MTVPPTSLFAMSNKVALIVGVANRRSIAWACVQSFIASGYDCILTYQSERFRSSIASLVASQSSSILGSLPCNVEMDIPLLCSDGLPEVLGDRRLNAVVHSVAYADFEGRSFSQASSKAFLQAQHISAYSLLELANHCRPLYAEQASLTTLSYIGAVRAVEGYHIMGPAKASLEATVRGLAAELGSYDDHTRSLRVNAVSAGPLSTLSARGIPGFSKLASAAAKHSPLRRGVTAEEVASTVVFLADKGKGITGQTIYVDGGLSSVLTVD